jgi:hypothetical protein
MLTEKEYEVLKNELTKYFVLIPPECVIIRVKDVLHTIEFFIKEKEDGSRQEGVEKEELLEERVEPETGGEDRGTQSSSSSI